MRTTFDLNDELVRQARRRAADENVSLKELVERGLRLLLGAQTQKKKPYKFKLRTHRSGYRAGVPRDFTRLLNFMDEHP